MLSFIASQEMAFPNLNTFNYQQDWQCQITLWQLFYYGVILPLYPQTDSGKMTTLVLLVYVVQPPAAITLREFVCVSHYTWMRSQGQFPVMWFFSICYQGKNTFAALNSTAATDPGSNSLSFAHSCPEDLSHCAEGWSLMITSAKLFSRNIQLPCSLSNPNPSTTSVQIPCVQSIPLQSFAIYISCCHFAAN